MALEPITLRGETVRLESLSFSYLCDLVDAAEPGIVEWFTRGRSSRDAMRNVGRSRSSPSHQRTGANIGAKYRMLGHAFETCDCVRVELKPDTRNTRSRDAIR